MLIRHPARKQLSLQDILKKRRATLSQWISEVGICTYSQLVEQCKLMGVRHPSLEDCAVALSPYANVSVPTEGIISIDIEPIIVLDETTGEASDGPTDVDNTVIYDFEIERSKPSKNRIKKR